MSLNPVLSSDSIVDDLDVQLSHPAQNGLRVEIEGRLVDSIHGGRWFDELEKGRG